MVLSRAVARFLVGGGVATSGYTAYRYSAVLEKERLLPTEPLRVFQEKKTDSKKQRVIVVGGGVVGVTAAYKLAKKGHSVVLLEPASQPATQCSACAAGGMQRSNPVVDREHWIAVMKCLNPFHETGFVFFNISWTKTITDPFFLRWLCTFTKTSLFPDTHQEEKQKEMLKFTDFAVNDMVSMMEKKWDNLSKKAGYNNKGSVSVSYDPVVQDSSTDEQKSNTPAHSKSSYEPARQLVGEELFQEEPMLRQQEVSATSAKYEWEAKSASSERFTKELATRCVNDPALDVSFQYNCSVKGISVEQGTDGKKRISKLKTNRGVVTVPEDAKIVVAAGAWTPHVLALMDLYAPVYPLKGYAMSVSAETALKTNPALKPQDLPSRIVADKYMYTTRLGDEIRITSIGEFSGWNTAPTSSVDAGFRREAVRQLPQLQHLIVRAATKCGHRPLVADGILLLGAVDTHENLFVSTGPGSNGWKLACGSGEIIERLVSGQSEQQIADDLGFDVSAFSPANRVKNAPVFAKLCRARWHV